MDIVLLSTPGTSSKPLHSPKVKKSSRLSMAHPTSARCRNPKGRNWFADVGPRSEFKDFQFWWLGGGLDKGSDGCGVLVLRFKGLRARSPGF